MCEATLSVSLIVVSPGGASVKKHLTRFSRATDRDHHGRENVPQNRRR
jgi:hypothetical protein